METMQEALLARFTLISKPQIDYIEKLPAHGKNRDKSLRGNKWRR